MSMITTGDIELERICHIMLQMLSIKLKLLPIYLHDSININLALI